MLSINLNKLLLSRRTVLGGLALAATTLSAEGREAAAAKTEDDVLSEAAVLRDPDIPAAGNPDGDITIVEYFDYQCPYCRKVEPELRQVAQDDGKVRLVFKDWPVLGGASIYAARMALASRYQDKYIEAHDALIALNSKLTEPVARDLLAKAGIDVDRATRDLQAKAAEIDAVLGRNKEQAAAFGFRGTPSFIVGKFRVPGVLTMAQFDQAIADARAAAKKK
ncbi:MAG: disulfide bond formation protein DsbA [Rhizobiales bacterium 62-47]|nr:thioredoxin domain-containing protein [Hyphomicrobiales bacterium]OJY14073.1 MAG: disulfide bond formation protein DsbA [Rhizobiales bacterium 62-47]